MKNKWIIGSKIHRMKQTKQSKTNTQILNIEQHGPNRKQGLIQVPGKSKQFHLTVKEYMSAFSLAHKVTQ